MAPAKASISDSPPTYEDAVPPRLTRLEMIGFKSFASKTTFQFEKGITAVVGPNGSGKSNIADAVRWALGETSYSSLRSKKTEDVIFAGGSGKAPAGMAEVTLTFDNSTSWLPIDFAEVTVTRRAFRSGETAYLINGRKVRLKDVHQLTAGLGQSYTVVGQGLVDSALSQRAEERRGLFEHAADLTGLRLKAAEAERNLAETESNSARLNDLLAEVEPRLRQLERAAKQANEYRDVRDRLRSLQRVHFRRLLADVHDRLDRIEAAASEGVDFARGVQEHYDRLLAESAVARNGRESLGDRVEEQRAGLQATQNEIRRVLHERELANERLSAFTKRREDMSETQATLDAQIETVTRELESVEDLVTEAEEAVVVARLQMDSAESALATERSNRARREQERNRLLASISGQERAIADATRRRALAVQRLESDAAERSRTDQVASERSDRLMRLTADLAALDQSDETSSYRLTSIDAGVIELATSLKSASADVTQTRASVQEKERELAEATVRLRELRRIHESGAGLFAGVRAVIDASRKRQLSGIKGTLAELIELPKTYDTAMEVALGGHLQDIVVEQWSQAEAAIVFLKSANAGRATFQPIDTVRGRKPNAEVIKDVVGLAGVHGVASELISVSSELSGIVHALLGRSLIVDSLDVARACLPHMPSGWSAITLSGEIVRTAGSVTGGAAVRESGALGREREMRELPEQIVRLEKDLIASRELAEAAASRVKVVTDDRQKLEAERSALHATRREREAQRSRIASWLAEIRKDEERTANRNASLDGERVTAEATLAEVDAELETLRGELMRATEALQGITETPAGESNESATELAYRIAQRTLATNDERLSAERRRMNSLNAQKSTLDQERAIRAEREATVAGEISALTAQIERLDQELAALQETESSSRELLDPLVAEHVALVSRLVDMDEQLEKARADLLDAERSRGSVGMDVERIRGEASALHQRIQDDLDLDDPLVLLDQAEDDAPEGDEPVEMEREISRLKDRLRRVGYAGDNAIDDFEQERDRHAFLKEQLEDVEGAAGAIRTMLADLKATMHERFEETFQRVSIVFSQMFSTLFGGGTARLVMITGEDGDQTGGIDIVAQPPGKRLQTLSLLSGGERALTGVALLFAILRVNPTPFCLLDEVDAALDEANVVRFRDQLGQLAAETQAIIITHNRGTIEAANTLYGVSMREDGTSTVLSLRLSDVVLAD
jgi:chromosome segregation protein